MPASRILIRSACGGWMVFEDPVAVLRADSSSQVDGVLKEIDKACSSGLHVAGFLSYESAAGIDPHYDVHALSGFPYAWFGVYRGFRMSGNLPGNDGSYTQPDWQPSTNQNGYYRAINAIKSYIRAGDTYQVNYTIRLVTPFSGDPLALFKDMYRSQPSQYSAYIETGQFAVLSVSPELFFERDGRHLVSKPMKGTAPRGLYSESDDAAAAELSRSEKNRAENIMIVDMIRNDLGRIAEKGTVNVESTFDVERLPTVLQMTSTVSALSDCAAGDVLRSMFPCASITGAPKVRTMQIIKELEAGPRGIYTGAIGHIRPGGDMRFSVAIRTVEINRNAGTAQYGVGGGIVWDSVDKAEYDECISKAMVLSGRSAGFSLIDTMLWRQGSGYFLQAGHAERLRKSALYFGFEFDHDGYKARLDSEAESFKADTIVRILLDRSGNLTFETNPAPSARRFRVTLADTPVDSRDVFLYHKTTQRGVYEKARKVGYDDVLLYNEKMELTESTIANIVLEIDGQRITPYRDAGLLNGVFRADLLASGQIKEAVIKVQDLERAAKVWLINSVRGWIETMIE